MLRWIEGFELATTYDALALKYVGVVSTLPALYIIGPGASSPGAAYQIGHTSQHFTRWRTPGLTSQTIFIQGCRLLVPTGGLFGQSLHFFRFYAPNGQVQITIELFQSTPSSVTYGFKAWAGDPTLPGAVLLGTAADAVACELWQYVEVLCYCASSGGRVRIKLNGGSSYVLDLTNKNTNPAGTGSINACEWTLSAASGKVLRLDDVYILDATGGLNDDYLGDRVVEGVMPKADGAGAHEWTPSSGTSHEAMVDDMEFATYQDGDATTLQTSQTDKREFFDVADLALVQGVITGIQVNLVARISGGASRNVKPAFRSSGGSEAFGADITLDSTSFKHYQQVIETNPVTAAPFAIADVNAGQLGLKSA